MTMADSTHPILRLEAEDLEFVLKFVLASGSLKEVATLYGVSYPTIRARLDRLIGRLQMLSAGRTPDPMADLLADYVAQGQLSGPAAKQILRLHREREDSSQGKST